MSRVRFLKRSLDALYSTYDFQGRLAHDPVEIPRRYGAACDIEISGFIAACLAYGRVDLFKPVVERVLAVMGESPSDYLKGFVLTREAPRFRGVRYRFAANDDILMLLTLLGKVLRRHGSIEAIFMAHFLADGNSVRSGLSGLVDTLRAIAGDCPEGMTLRLSGFPHFLPSPRAGSACKRLNLFLRWMVRDRDLDFGIWRDVPKNALIIPLDTHIARVGRCLGFTTRTSMDWKTAEEITSALRAIDPEDPLRYDFALCHLGISGECGSWCRPRCRFTRHRIAACHG